MTTTLLRQAPLPGLVGVLAIVALSGLFVAGCGGSASAAEKFAANELTIYVLDGGVSCDETTSSDTETRYVCHADAVVNGVTQPVTLVVQCVDGGVCSRVPT